MADNLLSEWLSPTMKKNALNALTGARFFAAMYVVVHHFFASALGSWSPGAKAWLWPVIHWIDRGPAAVNFFFVLSGFILAYNYGSATGEMSCRKRDFWVARFARIWPMFAVAALIAFPLLIRVGLYANKSLSAVLAGGLGHLLGNLVLLNAWFPAWNDINVPGWSLSTEMFFYLVFPFALGPLGRLSNGWLAVLALVFYALTLLPPWVICGGYPFTTNLYEGDTAHYPDLFYVMKTMYWFPPFRLPEFLIGVTLGIVFLRRSSEKPRRLTADAGIAVTALLLALALIGVVPWPILRSGFYTPFSAWVIWALARRQEGMVARFLAWSPMVLLGEASYAIYLLHNPVMRYLTIILFHFYRGPSFAFTFLLFVLTVLIVIPLSIGLFWIVEEPARKFLRKKLSTVLRPAHLGPDVSPLDVVRGG